jgi:hypothetical protein
MRSASEIKLVAPASINEAIQMLISTATAISKVFALEFGAMTAELATIVTQCAPRSGRVQLKQETWWSTKRLGVQFACDEKHVRYNFFRWPEP